MKKDGLNKIAWLCRWTARVLGSVLVFICVVIAIGQGIPNPFTQPVAVQIGFLALTLILSGMVAGWRWELTGGIVSLIGWSLFVASVMKGPRPITGFLATLALPGPLFVVSALLKGRSGRVQPQ